MARVRRPGIVARPGKHKDEVVTAKELQRAVQFQNRIPLIIGPHPLGGYSSPMDWIGTVSTKWNDTEQRVDGEFSFFDEEWDRIPPEVRRMILNRERINLSAGYQIGEVVDGVQIGRKWDHLALNVTDPLHDDVGVNIRMESEFPDNFRTEETPEIPGEEKKEQEPTPAAAPAITEDQVKGWITDAMAAVVASQKPKEQEPQEPEKTPEEEVEEAKPDPVPKEVLPASAPSKDDMEGIEVQDDGWWKL
jgi:hypothetical protein